MAFRDHFSGHADAYSRARPSYPAELFVWLSAQTPVHHLAWDCGAGNGQAAVGLAAHFDRVVGSDASAAQIAQAPATARVSWRVAREDDSGLADQSVDLATVAQALHWFDASAYFTEARRVVKPGGVIAVWSYGLVRIDPRIDAVIGRFYRDEVGHFWPAERRQVETGYQGITFPFEEFSAPSFAIRLPLDLAGVLRYIATWSAVQRCQRDTGVDPMLSLRDALGPLWGNPELVRPIEWPLAMRVGRRGER